MFLGLDIGTSSIKAALLDAESGRQIAIATSPQKELPIDSPQPGFAEQDPDVWWDNAVRAVRLLPAEHRAQVKAIGIGYQMHGLVLVDDDARPTRNAIIWCDSRAATLGDRAYRDIGDYCRTHLLNSPGNFTAAKIRWVIENEPDTTRRSRWAMLPGDFIALKLTRTALTTNSGLSEMALWDFSDREVSSKLLDHFAIDHTLIPEYVPTFSAQGELTTEAAEVLGVPHGTAVTFRAGDQPTNALALGVLRPGEVAATAGTSGVIYSVTDEPFADPQQRVNTFLHVNRSDSEANNGVLCCINGCGSLNSWLRNELFEGKFSYEEMNRKAAAAPPGSAGLLLYPFGNGAERILGNVNLGATMAGLDFTRHAASHVCRAAQESIAFAMFYGIESLPRPSVIRASNSNLFLSPVFAQTVADLTGAVVEILDTQGVFGAAWGAAIGFGAADEPSFPGIARSYEPAEDRVQVLDAYTKWKVRLRSLVPAPE